MSSVMGTLRTRGMLGTLITTSVVFLGRPLGLLTTAVSTTTFLERPFAYGFGGGGGGLGGDLYFYEFWWQPAFAPASLLLAKSAA